MNTPFISLTVEIVLVVTNASESSCSWQNLVRFFRSYVRKKGYKDGITGFAIGIHSALYQVLSFSKYWEMKRKKDLQDKMS